MQVKRMMVALIALAVLACLLAASSQANAESPVAEEGKNLSNGPGASYVLRVDSDFELSLEAFFNGWPGTGNPGDPYIIDGLNIPVDAQGYAAGIYIGNTTQEFRIVNWRIFNCSQPVSGVSDFNPGAAIVLYNVVGPCSIESSDLSDNPSGAWVAKSTSITLSDLVCRNATGFGIASFDNTFSNISKNQLTNCDTGIALWRSNDTSIGNNTCWECQIGISLMTCSEDVLAFNNCSSSTGFGLYLGASPSNLLRNNSLWNDSVGIWLGDGSSSTETRGNDLLLCGTGLWLNSSDGLVVSNSTFQSCLGKGVFSQNAGSSLLLEWNQFAGSTPVGAVLGNGTLLVARNNTFVGQTIGLRLFSISQALLRDNDWSAGDAGTELFDCPSPSILANTMDSLAKVGARLEGCDSAALRLNQLQSCGIGIWLRAGSDLGTVHNNTLTDCGIGIQVDGSSTSNVLIGNQLGGVSSEGIRVEGGSSGNQVLDNACEGQAVAGIHVMGSDGVLVSKNRVKNMPGRGIWAQSCGSIAIDNNTCLSIPQGIDLNVTNGAIIKDNVCQGSSLAGIFLYQPTGAQVRKNNCSANGGSGIVTILGVQTRVENNSLYANARSGLRADGEGSLRLANNKLGQNALEGALLRSCIGTSVYGNSFRKDAIGLHLASGQSENVHNNLVSGATGIGLLLEGEVGAIVRDNQVQGCAGRAVDATGCQGSTFYLNLFQGNNGTTSSFDPTRKQARDDSATDAWSSSGFGNYWTDLAVPDANRDGIVDTPYPLVGTVADPRPLSGPLGPVTGLSAINGKVYVLLKWNAPNYTAVGPLTAYSVEKRNLTGTTVFDLLPNETELNDTSVSQSSDYTYDIIARSAYGRSVNLTVLVLAIDNKPPVVTVTSPAYGSSINSTSFVARWSGSDVGSGIVRYELRLDQAAWQDLGTSTELTIPPLPQGWHNISVRAWDGAGNNATNRTMFFVDAYAPIIQILSPSPGAILNSTSVPVQWSATDNGTGVQGYQTRIDQGPWSPVQAANSSLLIILGGAHIVQVRAIDEVGNIQVASLTLTVDPYPPTVAISSPAQSYLGSGMVALSWTAQDNVTSVVSFDIRVDGGNWSPQGLNLSAQLTLAEGAHVLEVRALDAAGNYGNASRAVIIDLTPPQVRVVSPANGTYVNTRSVLVTWNATDDGSGMAYSEVRVDAGTWSSPSTGTSFLTPSLSEGQHLVEVRAWDLAGNNATNSSVFFLDTSGPQVQWAYPPSGANLNTTFVNLSWQVSDVGSGVNRTQLIVDGQAPIELGNATNHTLSDLTEGQHSVTVRVYDLAGNSVQVGTGFRVDVTPPSVTISYPGEGSVVQARDINVVWGGSDSGSGIARFYAHMDVSAWINFGYVTSYVFKNLADGPHTVYVKALDGAGNEFVRTSNFTVDMTAPEVEILFPADGHWVNVTELDAIWQGSDQPLGMAYYEVRFDLGNWTNVGLNTTLHLSGLAVGNHRLDVRGHSNSSQSILVTSRFGVDLTAPSAPSWVKPLSKYVTNGQMAVSWRSATDNVSGIASYELRIARSYYSGGVLVTEVGPWANQGYTFSYVSSSNPDGYYNLTVRAVDRAGNQGTNDTLSLTFDSVAPTALSYEPIGSAVSISANMLVVFSEPMDPSTGGVSTGGKSGFVTWEGATVLRFTTYTPWKFNTTYQIEVNCKDLAGNQMNTLRWAFTTIPDQGIVSGRVVDPRGSPLQGALISTDEGQTTATDPEGNFQLGVPSGVHTLTISYKGYSDLRLNLTIVAGEPIELGEVSLSQSGTDFSWVIILTFVLLVAVAIELIYLQRKRRK